MSQWARRRKPPKGFEVIEPTLKVLEDELRARSDESVEGRSAAEALWPIHQLNWQRSRYVYDMFYEHERIPREVYEYCVDNKIVDAGLIAKWKKRGYEKLCSTYVINPKNYPYGTVSMCRVPRSQLKSDTLVRDHTTGCRGCATGQEGFENIFGNKYGQRLAEIQIQREQAAEAGGYAPPGESVWADEPVDTASVVRPISGDEAPAGPAEAARNADGGFESAGSAPKPFPAPMPDSCGSPSEPLAKERAEAAHAGGGRPVRAGDGDSSDSDDDGPKPARSSESDSAKRQRLL